MLAREPERRRQRRGANRAAGTGDDESPGGEVEGRAKGKQRWWGLERRRKARTVAVPSDKVAKHALINPFHQDVGELQLRAASDQWSVRRPERRDSDEADAWVFERERGRSL